MNRASGAEVISARRSARRVDLDSAESAIRPATTTVPERSGPAELGPAPRAQLRVVHVAPSVEPAFGGPTQALLGWLLASQAAGVECEVLAPACSPEDLAWFQAQVPRVVVRTFRRVGQGSHAVPPGMLAWLVRAADRYDVAHVHGLLNLTSSLGALAAQARGLPVVASPFGTLSRYTFSHRKRLLKRLWFALLDGPMLRRAAAVHFHTESERDEAGWHGIDFGGRAHVVSPPLVWEPPAVREPGTSGRTVLFLSRIHPKKGLEHLVEAWPLVRAQEPGARLVVAGDGDPDYVARLKARAVQIGVEPGAVTFAGFVSGAAKAQCFAAADLFVLPSHQENFGVAVLEAMAAGLPVVITEDVQLAPFVLEHNLGIVAGRRPHLLAAAVVKGLRDEDLRLHCAREGPALVRRRFGLRAIEAALEKMYHGAVSARRTQPPTL